MLAEYQIDLPPQTVGTAHAGAKKVLEEARTKLGFIPNMNARMANSPGLLDTYYHGYGLFRSQSGFSPQFATRPIAVANGLVSRPVATRSPRYTADHANGSP